MTLGKKLRALREDRGIFQREAAEKLGIALTTLSGYERDARKPDTGMLKRICEFYGVTTDYLIGTDTTLDNLEEEFPEGVQVLRRATKELSPEARAKMIKLMKAFLEEE